MAGTVLGYGIARRWGWHFYCGYSHVLYIFLFSWLDLVLRREYKVNVSILTEQMEYKKNLE